MRILLCAAAASALIGAGPAQAGELFGGLYVHDVKTPLTLSGEEGGVEIVVQMPADRSQKTNWLIITIRI